MNKIKSLVKDIKADKLLSHVLKSSSGSFLIKCINMLLSFSIAVLAARWMGAKEFGAFTFAFTIVGFLRFPAMFGLPNLAVREIAKFESAQNWAYIKGFNRSSYILISSLSIFLGTSTLIVLYFFDIQNKYTIALAVLCLPFFSLLSLQSSILRGIHRIVLSLIPEQIIKPAVLLIGLVILHHLSADTIKAEYAVMFQVLAIFLGFLVSLFWIRKFLKHQIDDVKSEVNYKKWLKAALPFTLMGSLSIINSQFDILMLGILSTEEDVGVYKVVYSLSQLLFIVMVALNTAINPLIASMYERGEKEALSKILILSTRAVSLITIPIFIVFLLKGEWILETFFGSEFKRGNIALIIASFGMLYNGLVGPVASILNMTGFEKITLWGSITVTLLNITLNPILIPLYGISGAAATTAICPLIANSYWLYFVTKKTGLKTLPIQNYKI